MTSILLHLFYYIYIYTVLYINSFFDAKIVHFFLYKKMRHPRPYHVIWGGAAYIEDILLQQSGTVNVDCLLYCTYNTPILNLNSHLFLHFQNYVLGSPNSKRPLMTSLAYEQAHSMSVAIAGSPNSQRPLITFFAYM